MFRKISDRFNKPTSNPEFDIDEIIISNEMIQKMDIQSIIDIFDKLEKRKKTKLGNSIKLSIEGIGGDLFDTGDKSQITTYVNALTETAPGMFYWLDIEQSLLTLASLIFKPKKLSDGALQFLDGQWTGFLFYAHQQLIRYCNARGIDPEESLLNIDAYAKKVFEEGRVETTLDEWADYLMEIRRRFKGYYKRVIPELAIADKYLDKLEVHYDPINRFTFRVKNPSSQSDNPSYPSRNSPNDWLQSLPLGGMYLGRYFPPVEGGEVAAFFIKESERIVSGLPNVVNIDTRQAVIDHLGIKMPVLIGRFNDVLTYETWFEDLNDLVTLQSIYDLAQQSYLYFLFFDESAIEPKRIYAFLNQAQIKRVFQHAVDNIRTQNLPSVQAFRHACADFQKNYPRMEDRWELLSSS